MSLDVYLRVTEPTIVKGGSGIFVRENGATRESSRAEWDEKQLSGREPVAVVSEEVVSDEVYSANITHNLGRMANAAGIYKHLWRPDEIGVTHAKQLIEPLKVGVAKMKADPDHFSTFDAENGWGTYEQFVPWIERYLEACERWPEATVHVSR